jgi:hypothetical protein
MTLGHSEARLWLIGGSRSGRRMRIASLMLGIVVALCLFVWVYQHQSPPTVTPTRPAAAVTGIVATQGGPAPLPGQSQSDVHPQRSVVVLVMGTTTTGVHLVRHVTTNNHGRFAVNLPPGHYTLTGLLYATSDIPRSQEPHTTVNVRRGHPLHIRIVSFVA